MNGLVEAPGVAYVVWGTGGARVKDMSHVFGGEAGVFVSPVPKQDWLLALLFWADALPSASANGGAWP